MRKAYALIAVVALVLPATDVAAAKPRHAVATGDSGQRSPSSTGGQTSGSESGGVAKNATPGPAINNTGDKGSLNSNGPTDNGPMKKGDSLPGKPGPQNAGKGTGDAGKGHIGDGADGGRHGTMGSNNGVADHGIDPIRSDNVIVDHRKSKKPIVDTTKKITTTVSPPSGSGNQRPSGLTAIGGGEKNAIGLASHNDKDSKPGSDPKIGAKGLEAGLPGPAGTKSSAVTVTTNIGHPANNPGVAEGPTRIGAGLNGALISRPGYGPSTIGGPVKNVASINGTSFRPKRGR